MERSKLAESELNTGLLLGPAAKKKKNRSVVYLSHISTSAKGGKSAI